MNELEARAVEQPAKAPPLMRHLLGPDYGHALCGFKLGYGPGDDLRIGQEEHLYVDCVVCADVWGGMTDSEKHYANMQWQRWGIV